MDKNQPPKADTAWVTACVNAIVTGGRLIDTVDEQGSQCIGLKLATARYLSVCNQPRGETLGQVKKEQDR